MTTNEFLPWPRFSDTEGEIVKRVLMSNKVNYLTHKTEGYAFESEFADFAGTNHAIALMNGTVAIDLALHGLGIGAHNGGKPTDEVIVTPRSFMASASCIVNAGARPVFADVDRDSQNITPETVAPHIGPNTRAILCVHLAGWPCDMDGFKALVAGTDIKLIEDCAQAHGARYKGRPVGSLGDVAAWSFCQDKIMTTGGEGGMVTCDDEALWKRMWSFKDHGKDYDLVHRAKKPPVFQWEITSFGTNWRLTEMQSALGRFQLTQMGQWHRERTKNANELYEVLAPFAGPDGLLRLPRATCAGCDGSCGDGSGCEHAWYKFYAFVRPENLPQGWTRDSVIEALRKQGLPCMQGSCSELYLEQAFEGTGFAPAQPLPVARELGETSIMFMVHPGVHRVDITL
jgi:dTDP-4-amino-4,6-dideoxygalactose transaminase